MNDFNLFEHIQGIQDQCVGDDGKFDETKLDEIILHSRHVGKLKRYDEVGMEIENGFTKAEELMGCPFGYLNNKPYGKGIKLSIQSTLAGGRQYEIETEKQVRCVSKIGAMRDACNSTILLFLALVVNVTSVLYLFVHPFD